jgi:nitroimidazol reductase NimA-like FMN-containing flavoprotein (pyridoxamine 5'-phosphate oxidase superfamily)
MTLDRQTELSPDETDALVARHETGVLALARDDDPYAIPVSYGYHPDERCAYLRLVTTPDSEKTRFLGSEPRARLVVQEQSQSDGGPELTDDSVRTDDAERPTYRSAILDGTLEPVDWEALTVEDVEGFGDAKPPMFDAWVESTSDLNVSLYRLDADDVGGRELGGRDPDGDSE